MSTLVTWWDMWKSAEAEAGIIVPTPGDSPQNALMRLSQAQHDLQTITNAVKRQLSIVIATASSDGSYSESLDVKLEQNMQLYPTGSAGGVRVMLITPEEMDRMKRDQFLLGAPNPPFDTTTQYYYTIEQGKLWLYPFAGVTGTLVFRYIPHLAWYTATAPTGDWVTIAPTGTVSLLDFMQANGPAREFTTATNGMADFLAATFIEESGVRNPGPRYSRLMGSWLETQQLCVRELMQLNKEMRPKPRNGPMM